MIKPLIGFVRIALSPFEFYPQFVLICIIVECHIMEVSYGRSYRIVELVKLRHIERGLLRQVGEYDFTRLHRFLRFPILILMYKLTKNQFTHLSFKRHRQFEITRPYFIRHRMPHKIFQAFRVVPKHHPSLRRSIRQRVYVHACNGIFHRIFIVRIICGRGI